MKYSCNLLKYNCDICATDKWYWIYYSTTFFCLRQFQYHTFCIFKSSKYLDGWCFALFWSIYFPSSYIILNFLITVECLTGVPLTTIFYMNLFKLLDLYFKWEQLLHFLKSMIFCPPQQNRMKKAESFILYSLLSIEAQLQLFHSISTSQCVKAALQVHTFQCFFNFYVDCNPRKSFVS